MKQSLISLVILFFVSHLYCQQNTTIQGKIDDNFSRFGMMEIRWLDMNELTEKSERIEFNVEPGGTFFIKTDRITQPNTNCELHVGRNHVNILLSPGDSIYMTANAELFKKTANYSGIGAGKNNYKTDVFVNTIQFIVLRDPLGYYENLLAEKEKEINLLIEYLESGEIDSAYYSYEKNNIQLKWVYTILTHKKQFSNATGFSEYWRKVESVLSELSFAKEEYLYNIFFRKIVEAYPEYNLKYSTIDSEKKPSVEDEINFARSNYSDKIYQYYLSSLAIKLINSSESSLEAEILLEYFGKKIDLNKISKNKGGSKLFRQKRSIDPDFFPVAFFISLMFIGIVVILFLIQNFSKKYPHLKFETNWALLLKYVLFLVVIIIAGTAFAETSRFIEFLAVLVVLGIFLAHTFIVIPKIALKRKYGIYIGILFLVYALAMVTFHITVKSKDNLVFHYTAALTAILGISMFSWILYYIHILSKKKTTFKGLFRENYLSGEAIFNSILVLILLAIFVENTHGNSTIFDAATFFATIALFYIHSLIVFPRYFRKGKYLHFIGVNILVIISLVIGSILLHAFYSYFRLSQLGITPQITDFLSLNNIYPEKLLASLFLLVPAFAYYYIKRLIKEQESKGFMLFRKKEAEYAQLRSQVNPHFLFNTLNTLYAYALSEKSEKTADCIAKLANLMRFMVDDMEKESIPLDKEVGYIEDYIQLQKIRSSAEHNINIKVDIAENKIYNIAPMLIIPFVENSFKHGMNPNKISDFSINIKAQDKTIQVVIENSIDKNFGAYYKEKGLGIGIENVKSRLHHVYPRMHNISIAETDNRFIVILKITTE